MKNINNKKRQSQADKEKQYMIACAISFAGIFVILLIASLI